MLKSANRGPIILAALILSLQAILSSGQLHGADNSTNSSQPTNATDGDDEQDSYQEPLEEFPGPFMIRKLHYRIVDDESEPDYFGILGLSRSSTLAKIRQSFRESSRSYRDLLMNFRSTPHISRLNVTNSTKRSPGKEKVQSKSTRIRSRPLFRPTLINNTNTSNATGLTQSNESSPDQISARAAAREIAAKKREAENLRRLNDFMSRSEAYRVLTNPRLPIQPDLLDFPSFSLSSCCSTRRIYEVSGAYGLRRNAAGPRYESALHCCLRCSVPALLPAYAVYRHGFCLPVASGGSGRLSGLNAANRPRDGHLFSRSKIFGLSYP